MDVLCLDREMSLQTCGEGRAVSELDMNFRAVHSVLVDRDGADNFIAQFFAMDHGYLALLAEHSEQAHWRPD